jgi:RNA polymerase sigma-70 factor (ECF subfamily)
VGQRVFEQFVQSQGERAYRFAYHLCGDPEEAKELVQEALCRVLRHWDRYDPGRPLESWFFTILRHVFLDGRRLASRRLTSSLDAPPPGARCPWEELLPDAQEPALERLEREEAARLAARALEGLRYEHRAVLHLCDGQGLRYEEIARVLKVPVGTVRSRISRARIALRAALARPLGTRS